MLEVEYQKHLINHSNNNSTRDFCASKDVLWSLTTGETVVEIEQ